MALQVIRYAEQPDMPWANGLGSTRQLWADRSGERRISVAQLRAPAPFSALPGMARLLLVLDPIQITLNIGGQRVQLARHEMVGFSGDDPVELLHLDHPGRVLNIMANAACWAPALSAAAEPPPFAWAVLGDAQHGAIRLHAGDLAFGNEPIREALGIHFEPTARQFYFNPSASLCSSLSRSRKA